VRFSLYETRLARKSLSFPTVTGRLPTSSMRRRLAYRSNRYALRPQPAYTPIEPSCFSGSQPASSRASQAHSRNTRCCGSVISASLALKPKNEASNRSTSSSQPAART
jgi:hypothetical protein